VWYNRPFAPFGFIKPNLASSFYVEMLLLRIFSVCMVDEILRTTGRTQNYVSQKRSWTTLNSLSFDGKDAPALYLPSCILGSTRSPSISPRDLLGVYK